MFKRYQLSNGNRKCSYDADMHPFNITARKPYDVISSNGNGFNEGNLNVYYEIDYQDETIADAQEKGKWNLEPWEYYHTVETDSLSCAVKEYCFRMMDKPETETKFFMQIRDENGESIAETAIDMPNDFYSHIRMAIDKDINKKISSYESEIEMLSRELNLYKRFVEEYHAMETFRKWKEDNDS